MGNGGEHPVSVQLGLVVTEMGLRYLHQSSPGRLYIRALIPLLTSLPVHHSGGMHKTDAAVKRREARSGLGCSSDEFGPEPPALGAGKRASRGGRLRLRP